MTRTQRWLLYAVPLLAGVAGVWVWMHRVGSAAIVRPLARSRIDAVLLAVLLTGAWLFTRFIRWQFLLRRSGVRIPIRSSFGSYLAGLPGTATPAYVGEVIRGVFVRRRFGAPLRVTTAVLVLERLYDVAALALLLLASAGTDGRALRLGTLFLAGVTLGMVLAWPVARRAGLPVRVRSADSIVPALILSLLAWLLASWIIAAAGLALGHPIGLTNATRVFSESTLLGAVTLLPAGFGATGSAAILELGRVGLPVADAVPVVTLARLASTGLALGIGVIFLVRELRLGRSPASAMVPTSAEAHFDEIAAEYSAQWSPHVWDLLLDRKLGLVAAELPGPPASAGLGLDLGCGLGLQLREMTRRGFRVIGVDPSVGLLARGRAAGSAEVAAASALALPFADGSLDFVYVIGVLHHLPGRDAQDVACGEVARVLRPGGLFLVHESNPRNPLFRFYMGYLFPILKTIDEGTEWWIDPRAWDAGADARTVSRAGDSPRLHLERVRYFTFLPDFTPRALMSLTLAVERWLEGGPTRFYSAHYLAVLRRAGSSTAAGAPSSRGETRNQTSATA